VKPARMIGREVAELEYALRQMPGLDLDLPEADDGAGSARRPPLLPLRIVPVEQHARVEGGRPVEEGLNVRQALAPSRFKLAPRLVASGLASRHRPVEPLAKGSERALPSLLEPGNERQTLFIRSPSIDRVALMDLLLQPGVGFFSLSNRRVELLLCLGHFRIVPSHRELQFILALGVRFNLMLLDTPVELLGVLAQGKSGVGQRTPHRDVGVADAGGGGGRDRLHHREDRARTQHKRDRPHDCERRPAGPPQQVRQSGQAHGRYAYQSPNQVRPGAAQHTGPAETGQKLDLLLSPFDLPLKRPQGTARLRHLSGRVLHVRQGRLVVLVQ